MATTESQTDVTTPREASFSDYGGQKQPVPDLLDYVRDYARERPEVAAMWCFGIGFVLGWKLKPW